MVGCARISRSNRCTCNNVVFAYSEYNKRVSEEQSTVKLPDEVTRDSAVVIDTIQWTAGLDDLFKDTRAKDPSIR